MVQRMVDAMACDIKNAVRCALKFETYLAAWHNVRHGLSDGVFHASWSLPCYVAPHHESRRTPWHMSHPASWTLACATTCALKRDDVSHILHPGTGHAARHGLSCTPGPCFMVQGSLHANLPVQGIVYVTPDDVRYFIFNGLSHGPCQHWN